MTFYKHARRNLAKQKALTPDILSYAEPTVKHTENSRFPSDSLETQHKQLISSRAEVAKLQTENLAHRKDKQKLQNALRNERRNAQRTTNALGKFAELLEKVVADQRQAFKELSADLVPNPLAPKAAK